MRVVHRLKCLVPGHSSLKPHRVMLDQGNRHNNEVLATECCGLMGI